MVDALPLGGVIITHKSFGGACYANSRRINPGNLVIPKPVRVRNLSLLQFSGEIGCPQGAA